jgi:hypothetical protein
MRSVRWKRSIFPVVVGERGSVRMWSTPFSRQMRSKSHLDGRLGEPPSEDLAVVDQHLGRHTIGLQSWN